MKRNGQSLPQRLFTPLVMLAALLPAGTLSAQNPFSPVQPTGKPYSIVVTEAGINGQQIQSGSWIAVFSGDLAVGAAQFTGDWPVAVTAWQGDATQNLPGFAFGDSISFKIHARYYDAILTLEATATFTQGDGTFGAGAFSAVTLQASSDRVPNLTLDSREEIDFGTIRIGESASSTFTLRNEGTARLTVSPLSTDRADFTVQSSQAQLDPGGERTYTVTFSPTVAEPIQGSLTIASDDPDEPVITLGLSGQGLPLLQPVLSASQASLNFGYVPSTSHKETAFFITNQGNATLSVQSMSTNAVEFSVQAGPFDLEPGEKKSITVRFDPSGTGSRNANLIINSNASPAQTLLPLSGISYQAYFPVAPPTGIPYTVVFERIEVDKSTLEAGDQVALYSGDRVVGQGVFEGTWPMNLTAWQASSDQNLPGFAPGDTISVYANPSRFGARSSVLLDSLSWTQGDGTFGAVPLTAGSAFGFSGRAPDIRVELSALDFQDRKLGESDTLEVTLYNDGATALEVTLNTDAPFSALGNSTFSIAANGSQTVSVVFAPTTAGLFQKTLRITTNDPFDGSRMIDLSGRGLILLPQSPVVFEMPELDLLPIRNSGGSTWEIRLRNPYSEPVSGSLQIDSDLEGFTASGIPDPLTIQGDRSVQFTVTLSASETRRDTLDVRFVSTENDTAGFQQDAFSYTSMFEPVTPTGKSYSVVIEKITTAGQALQAGDEIALLDGQTVVGTGLYVGSTTPIAITAWQADSEQNLDGFKIGNPISIRVAKSVRGFDGRQIVHPRSTDFSASGNFGDGAFQSVDVALNAPPFWYRRLSDEQFEVNAFTTLEWARLDTLVVDVDGGSLDFGVQTDQTGLTASIANNRIFLTMQPNFVGFTDLILTATEGPYVLADTVRLVVIGEDSGELVRQRTQGDLQLFNDQPYPVPLTGTNGLYDFTGVGSITFTRAISGDPGITAEIRSDTLFVTASQPGSASVTVTAAAPTGQSDSQTFTVTRSEDTGGGGGGGTTPSGFKLPILVGNAVGTSQTLYIGFDSTASDAYDAAFDTLAPPPPPAGNFDARLLRDGEDYYADIVQPTDAAVFTTLWTLQYEAGTDGVPVTFSWSASALPAEGSFRIRDAINGSFVSQDMRTDSVLTIAADRSFVNKLEIVHSLSVTVSATYQTGWNLVSLPLQLEHDSFSEIFTSGMSNSLFGFTGTYVNRDVLHHGHGYWLRSSAVMETEFTGLPLHSVTMNIDKGWNLLGGLSDSVTFSQIQDPEGILLSTVYGFNGAYKLADALAPGYAYWVRATDAGTITLQSSSGQAKGVQQSPRSGAHGGSVDLSAFHRIEFSAPSDVNLRSTDGVVAQSAQSPTTLWFGADLPGGVSTEMFLMPPVPPRGTLDVRFEEGTSVSTAATGRLQVQQNGNPLVMRFMEPVDAANSEFRVAEFSDQGIIRERVAAAGNWMELSPAAIALEIERIERDAIANGDGLPTEFQLRQNYPNPFNPTTTIRFELPVDARVTLDVYNTLGQRVGILLDGPLKAGFHRVEFDGGGLPSGLYLASLKVTSGYSANIRMLLVK